MIIILIANIHHYDVKWCRMARNLIKIKLQDVTALSAVFLKSSRPSLPLKKAPPLISVFSPQGRRGKPPSGARNRFAIRLADQSKVSPCFAGWDRRGNSSLQLIVYSLQLILQLFADNLQISCFFLGGYEKVVLWESYINNIRETQRDQNLDFYYIR